MKWLLARSSQINTLMLYRSHYKKHVMNLIRRRRRKRRKRKVHPKEVIRELHSRRNVRGSTRAEADCLNRTRAAVVLVVVTIVVNYGSLCKALNWCCSFNSLIIQAVYKCNTPPKLCIKGFNKIRPVRICL